MGSRNKINVWKIDYAIKITMLIAIGEMFIDADFKKWIFLFPLHHPHASGENNNKSNGSNNRQVEHRDFIHC